MTAREQLRRQVPFTQFVAVMLATLLLFAFFSFARTMLQNYWLSADKAEWEQKIALEEARRSRLEAQLVQVESDAYQRQLAHEMGLYAPNEHPLVLILPPDIEDESRELAPILRPAVPLPRPYWQQWWELFLGDRKP